MSKPSEEESEEGISRRDMLRGGGATTVALVVGIAGGRAIAPGATATNKPTRQLAMAIDLGRCVGCQACSVACKAENGVRLGGFRSWVSDREIGAQPSVRRLFLPMHCNHCENPPCLDVCPTGATYRREDGIVDIDKAKCIGCRHCMGACPYSARYFNPSRTPDDPIAYPSRVGGTVDKCDFCTHRVDKGITPACVNTCPAGARTFGDLSDSSSDISRLLAQREARGLLPQFGTGPKVFYFGSDPAPFEGSDKPGGESNPRRARHG